MGLRFRKSIKLGGGVRLNIGKKSAGLSFGGKGLRYSVNTSGRRTRTVSIPGSGLSWSSTSGGSKSSGSPKPAGSRPAAPRKTPTPAFAPPASSGPATLPKPGLFAPGAEKRFYEGVQAFLKGDLAKAYQAFEAVSEKDSRNISDDLFAGVVAAQLEDAPKAVAHLEQVVGSEIELPDQLMRKYLPPDRANIQIEVGITPRVKASVGFSSLGAALLLAELYQEAGQLEDALGVIQQLHESDASDLALKLSLCDLLYEDGDDEGVIETALGVAAVDDLTLSILHLKAKALARQGLGSAALDAFSACLRRTSGMDRELLREIRYDRAGFYEASGKASLARREWERLYADDPKYRDVAQRVTSAT